MPSQFATPACQSFGFHAAPDDCYLALRGLRTKIVGTYRITWRVCDKAGSHGAGAGNGDNCVDASTGACTEWGGSDNDCCATCGGGGCAAGYTYYGQVSGQAHLHSDWWQSCDASYCGNTCCVPSDEWDGARAAAGE